MTLSLFIDSADYSAPIVNASHSKEDESFSLLEYALMSKYSQRYTPMIPTKDSRFSSFSFFKAHACLAYSAKVWAASNSNHFFNDKVLKPIALVTLPLGHLADFLLNSALGTIQTAAFLHGVAGKCAAKTLNLILSKEDQICLSPVETAALKTYGCAFSSFFNLFYENPLFFPFYSWGDLLETGEWIYEKNSVTNEGFVDQSKLDWIEKKYAPLYGPLHLQKEKLMPSVMTRGICPDKGINHRIIDPSKDWVSDSNYNVYFFENGREKPTIGKCEKRWHMTNYYPLSGIKEMRATEQINYNQIPLYQTSFKEIEEDPIIMLDLFAQEGFPKRIKLKD